MRIRPADVKWAVANWLRRLTGRKTLEQERQEKMKYLAELLYVPQTPYVAPGRTQEYFSKLASDFTLSSLTLAKRDGSVVISNMQDAFNQAVKGTSLYEYITSEMPDTKYVLIKEKDSTHMIYPDNGSLYLVEAKGGISSTEFSALVSQANKGAKDKKVN